MVYAGMHFGNEFKLGDLNTAIESVCEAHGVSEEELKGSLRLRTLTYARFNFYAICRKYTTHSITSIANALNRHHTTVVHGTKQHHNLYKYDAEYKDAYNRSEGVFLEKSSVSTITVVHLPRKPKLAKDYKDVFDNMINRIANVLDVDKRVLLSINAGHKKYAYMARTLVFERIKDVTICCELFGLKEEGNYKRTMDCFEDEKSASNNLRFLYEKVKRLI